MIDLGYNRKLILEDGEEYMGFAFGYTGEKVLELVFNTSMVGYQEILSDPSYTDQAVIMTYPLDSTRSVISPYWSKYQEDSQTAQYDTGATR